jgi:hypothetical protein
MRRKAAEAGVFNREDLALLGRVFDQTTPENETERARQARASRIIGYFQAGIRDEAELCSLVRQPLGR